MDRKKYSADMVKLSICFSGFNKSIGFFFLRYKFKTKYFKFTDYGSDTNYPERWFIF